MRNRTDTGKGTMTQRDEPAKHRQVRNVPLRIGLTGNIGSGKSTVAQIFSHLGVPTFNADKIGHEIIESNAAIKDEIVRTFGGDPRAGILVDGKISRDNLAKIVFSSAAKKTRLESILHPAIISEVNRRIWDLAGNSYAIVEAALIYEAELAGDFDYVILVKANKETAVERASRNLGLSKEEIIKRMKTQIPQSAKEKLADFTISNDGSVEDLKERVKLLHTIIVSLSRQAVQDEW